RARIRAAKEVYGHPGRRRPRSPRLAIAMPPTRSLSRSSGAGAATSPRVRQYTEEAMVISNPALVVVTDTRDRFLRRLGNLCRLRRPGHAPSQYDPSPAASQIPVAANPRAGFLESTSTPVAEPDTAAMAPRKSVDVEAREIVLTADERRARAIALR